MGWAGGEPVVHIGMPPPTRAYGEGWGGHLGGFGLLVGLVVG